MKYIIFWVAFLMIFLVVFPIMLFVPKTVNDNKKDIGVSVLFHETGEVKNMMLEEYLFGVLMAEMPAKFEIEALKSQAVAARTYTLNKIKSQSVSAEHNGADICTDFSHCQAYVSKEQYQKSNKNASENLKKFKKAISTTSGEIVVYNNEPIKAVFHSTSSGKTENASDVWDGDVPYLVSVESPGEELSPSYKSEVVKSVDEFKDAFKNYNVNFGKSLIGKIKRSESGAVKTIEIGDKTFKGTQLRTIFGLRSACFEVKVSGEKITFYVTGNGHGVGMSQYGANYLASNGYDYKEILKKYYSGVEIINFNE